MIEVVIKHVEDQGVYVAYEPTSDTIIASESVTDLLVNLSAFLVDCRMLGDGQSILDCEDISYHIDSKTMKQMIESNLTLLKRLNTAPGGFQLSQQRFGGGGGSSAAGSEGSSRGSSNKSRGSRSSGTFSNSGFKDSYKKFGQNKR